MCSSALSSVHPSMFQSFNHPSASPSVHHPSICLHTHTMCICFSWDAWLMHIVLWERFWRNGILGVKCVNCLAAHRDCDRLPEGTVLSDNADSLLAPRPITRLRALKTLPCEVLNGWPIRRRVTPTKWLDFLIHRQESGECVQMDTKGEGELWT